MSVCLFILCLCCPVLSLVASEIIMERINLLCKPQCIYKVDENELENCLFPPPKEVIAERGIEIVQIIDAGS
jgi:hypothetical protein